MLSVLLKKQITEKLSVFKKDKRRMDISGALLTLILVGALIAICVIVLSRFVKMYCGIRFHGVSDIPARQFELLTVIYAVIMAIGVLSGIRAINFSLFESDDRNILITLPLKSSTIFYSKMITAYLKQVFVFALILLPVNLTFAAVTGKSAYYVVMSIIMCFVFPLITLAFSSIFCLPVYLIKRFINSKYTFVLLIATAVTAVLFWFYSEILSFIKTMMTTGEIRFFFREETMNGIITAANLLYPSNVIARVLLGMETGKNAGILIGTALGAGLAGFMLVRLLYNKASTARAVSGRRFSFRAKKPSKKRSPSSALILKEFGLIMRTPSYAFQYFSVAAVMPLMVYFCMGIGRDLLSSLIMTESNFELAIFLVLMFGTLTNTFCATNISREGPAFYSLKTMPLKYEKILGAKIAFCSFIACASTAVSCIVLAALGYLTAAQTAFVFFIAVLLAEAQICFATRKDLNHPSFSTDEDCEVRESNSTVSEIIIAGLIISSLLGGVSLYLSVISGGKSQLYTMLFAGLTSVAVLGASVAYLLIGLKKKFYGLTEDN